MSANTPNNTKAVCSFDLLSTWSHNGLSPLTILKGFSDLLYDGYVGTLNQQQKASVHTISLSTQKVTDSWYELIDYFRHTTLKPQNLSPQKLTENEIDTLRVGIIDPAIITLKTIQEQTAELLNGAEGELTAQQSESLEAIHRACFSAIQRWHEPLNYLSC